MLNFPPARVAFNEAPYRTSHDVSVSAYKCLLKNHASETVALLFSQTIPQCDGAPQRSTRPTNMNLINMLYILYQVYNIYHMYPVCLSKLFWTRAAIEVVLFSPISGDPQPRNYSASQSCCGSCRSTSLLALLLTVGHGEVRRLWSTRFVEVRLG